MTTDLPFARDVCGDAALYFPPNNAERAAEQIECLAGNDRGRDALVKRGEDRLASMITPDAAFDRFMDILALTARSRS